MRDDGRRQPVLEARCEVHLQLDLTLRTASLTNDQVWRVGAQVVVARTLGHGQGIAQLQDTVRSPEGRAQDQGILEVVTLHIGDLGRSDAEMTGVLIEDAREDRGAGEVGQAPPVDRAGQVHEDSRMKVRQQCLVGDGMVAHVSSPIFAIDLA